MASYDHIRRKVKRDLGLTDAQMKYVASESAAADAIFGYGETIQYMVDMPDEVVTVILAKPGARLTLKIDPSILESFRQAFRENMDTIFPGRGKFWDSELKAAEYISRQILRRSNEGRRFYEAFIRHQIRSWNHPNLAKQPLNYLPSEFVNPDCVTVFRKTGKKVTTGETPHPTRAKNTRLRTLVAATVPGAE